MCGIAGYVSDKISPENHGVLIQVADTMERRGPDGRGYYAHKNVGLCHRRLSIIDIDGGTQPMKNDDESVILVFNGEIFNFLELKAQLIAEGLVFHTQCDTEVLLRLYERDGWQMVRKLNGFFAFCIYDRRKNCLILGRDRLGIKPCYYYSNGSDFAFASELKALRKFPFCSSLDLNPSMVFHYYEYQYVPPDKSIFRSVKKLPPACIGILSADHPENGMQITRYWEIDYSRKTSLTYTDACAKLQTLMVDAVKKRMISDVPLGVSLSGGMDSAIVCGLAAEYSDLPLQTFSIGVPEPRYDESTLAEKTANHLKKFARNGLEHHLKIVDPCDFDLLKLLAERFGEPFADASMLPTFLLNQFQKQFVTVSLGGDGADEFFAGYERYLAVKYMQRFKYVPKGLVRWASDALPANGERSKTGRLKRFLTSLSKGEGERYTDIVTHNAKEIIPVFASEFLSAATASQKMPFRFTAGNAVETAMEEDMQNYLPGDILVKADVCSMAASVELRSPFLDYRIVEFAASLPLEWKLCGSFRKKILAETFGKYLADDLPHRRKRGFGVPVSQWIRGPWREKVKDVLLDSRFADDDFVTRNGVEQVLQQHNSGAADYGVMIFSMLMFAFFEESLN